MTHLSDRQLGLWLCLPPCTMALLDGTLTLLGQRPEYWSGDYAALSELNPVGWLLLRWHPWAFAVGLAFWVIIIVAAVTRLPRRFAVGFMFVVFFAHSIGVASWLLLRGDCGLALAAGSLVLAERLLSFSMRRARAHHERGALRNPPMS